MPGLQDRIAAKMAQRVGFDVVYGSGYRLTASSLGLPDAGLASDTERVDRMETLVRSSGGAAVIADADTGYVGLLNVQHTVRGYERAGVSALQIEDQLLPKRCGHTPGKRCVSTQVPAMTSLVAAAMEQALRRLKDEGVSQSSEQPMFDFMTFSGLIGFEEVWAFDKRWAR